MTRWCSAFSEHLLCTALDGLLLSAYLPAACALVTYMVILSVAMLLPGPAGRWRPLFWSVRAHVYALSQDSRGENRPDNKNLTHGLDSLAASKTKRKTTTSTSVSTLPLPLPLPLPRPRPPPLQLLRLLLLLLLLLLLQLLLDDDYDNDDDDDHYYNNNYYCY